MTDQLSELDPSASAVVTYSVREEEDVSGILDADDDRIQTYNFYHQETIERIRLRPLEPVLEAVAHRVASTLASALRQPVVIDVTDAEQMSWEEYVASIPDPTFVTSALSSPVDGRLLIHIPVPLALQIVDCYLGGDGFEQPQRDQLTDIERVFITPLLEESWGALATAFSSTLDLRLGLIQSASSALNLPIGRATDMCWVVGMSIQVGDNRPQRLQLVLAVSWLLPHIEQIEADQASGVVEERPDYKEARQRLMAVSVEMRLAYPPITLTTSEILGLRPGDVISVREGTPEETSVLDLVTGDILIGQGILTERGNKLACTVVSKTEAYT